MSQVWVPGLALFNIMKEQKELLLWRKTCPNQSLWTFFQVNTLHQHGMLTLSTKKSKTIQLQDASKFQVSKTTETRATSTSINLLFQLLPLHKVHWAKLKLIIYFIKQTITFKAIQTTEHYPSNKLVKLSAVSKHCIGPSNSGNILYSKQSPIPPCGKCVLAAAVHLTKSVNKNNPTAAK